MDWGSSIHSPMELGGDGSLGWSQEGNHEVLPLLARVLAVAFGFVPGLYEGERLACDLSDGPSRLHPARSRHPRAPHTSHRAILPKPVRRTPDPPATAPGFPSQTTRFKCFGVIDHALPIGLTTHCPAQRSSPKAEDLWRARESPKKKPTCRDRFRHKSFAAQQQSSLKWEVWQT